MSFKNIVGGITLFAGISGVMVPMIKSHYIYNGLMHDVQSGTATILQKGENSMLIKRHDGSCVRVTSKAIFKKTSPGGTGIQYHTFNDSNCAK